MPCADQRHGKCNWDVLLVFFCLLSHTHINTVTAIAFEHLVETVDTFVLSPLHSLLKSNFDVLKLSKRPTGWKWLPLQLRYFTLFLFLFFIQFFLWMSNDHFSLAFFLPLLCCEIRIKSNSAVVVTFCMVMHCADSVGQGFFPHLLFSGFRRQFCSASLSSKNWYWSRHSRNL